MFTLIPGITGAAFPARPIYEQGQADGDATLSQDTRSKHTPSIPRCGMSVSWLQR